MKFVSLLPEEESDDGHEGGGGEDNLCPLVLHHHAPPCPALAPLPHPAQVGGMVCRHLALGSMWLRFLDPFYSMVEFIVESLAPSLG